MIFPWKASLPDDLCRITIYVVFGILFCILDYSLKNIWTISIKYS